jgi:hypothetical protein
LSFRPARFPAFANHAFLAGGGSARRRVLLPRWRQRTRRV